MLMNIELPSLKSVCATIQREEIHGKIMSHDAISSTQPDVCAYTSLI